MQSDSPAAAGPELTQALAALIDLGRRARHARSSAAVEFMLVNDSMALAPYRQAVLWHADRGLLALSGLVKPELNAPYALWLKQLCREILGRKQGTNPADRSPTPAALTAADLSATAAGEWAQWWPAQALCLPLGQVTNDAAPQALLLLVRDNPWQPAEEQLLTEWADAAWHAWGKLEQSGGSGRLGGLLGRSSDRSSGTRPWWRRPSVWVAAALVAASFIPVRLSVLAPGELVPLNPMLVRAPLDGVVDVFHVRPNQTVRKGDPLFGFDEALIQSRLDVANQALVTASTEYRQTLQQALGDPKVRTQLASLTGRIQEKRTEVTYLREQLTRARVLAPQDGTVLFDDPTEWIGRPVSVGERILRIAATGDIEVEAWLPIGDAIAIEPGARVQLFLTARPLEPLNATLRYVAHEAVQRPDGGFAYRVRATLAQPTDHRVGLKGTAKLEGDTVTAFWWVMRRPIASLRAFFGW